MLDYIKHIIIYFLIIFFMYVILFSETLIEGGVRKRYRDTRDDAKDVIDKTEDVVDYAKDSTKASYNNLKDATQQITEEVIGVVTGILGNSLDELASSVGRLNSTFNSASQNLTTTTNMSVNFEQDVVNSIANNKTYIATPIPTSTNTNPFGASFKGNIK